MWGLDSGFLLLSIMLFFISYCFEIIFGLQKGCKESTQSSQILFIQFPLRLSSYQSRKQGSKPGHWHRLLTLTIRYSVLFANFAGFIQILPFLPLVSLFMSCIEPRYHSAFPCHISLVCNLGQVPSLYFS